MRSNRNVSLNDRFLRVGSKSNRLLNTIIHSADKKLVINIVKAAAVELQQGRVRLKLIDVGCSRYEQ